MSDPAFVRCEAIVDGTSYEVLSLTITHRHAGLGGAVCALSDFEGGPTPEALIGKPALLIMRRDDQSACHHAGIVVEASHVGGDGEKPHAEIVVMPRMWRLSRRTDCRVFQNDNVEAIVRDVLERAGASDQDWSLTGSYELRG
jgi:uncharacterized protein involved in type VI secretion and phage assembly